MARTVGSVADKIWGDTIRVAVNDLRDDPDNGGKIKAVRLLARQLINKGLAGDLTAIREIGDRLDGRPAQYSEIAGAGGAPLQLIVETGVPMRTIEPPTVDIAPNPQPVDIVDDNID